MLAPWQVARLPPATPWLADSLVWQVRAHVSPWSHWPDGPCTWASHRRQSQSRHSSPCPAQRAPAQAATQPTTSLTVQAMQAAQPRSTNLWHPPPPARGRERCWASLAGTGRGQERAGSQQLPPGHLVQAKREAEDGLAGPSPPEQNASLDAQGPRDAVGACNPRTHLSTRGERTEGPAALAAGFDLGALLCRTPSCHPGLTWRHVEHCRILDGGQGLHEGVGIVRPAVPLGAECLLDVCGTGRGEGTVSACGGGGSSRAGRAAAWPSLQGSTGARGSAPHLQPPHTDRRAAASRMLQTLRTSSPEACPCCCRARLRSPRAPTGLHRERASRR